MDGTVFEKVASYDYKTVDTCPVDDACVFAGAKLATDSDYCFARTHYHCTECQYVTYSTSRVASHARDHSRATHRSGFGAVRLHPLV